MANTLLGYFKTRVAKQGLSTRYLNRDFLTTYLREYREAKQTGIANYSETKETRFYRENSVSYCVFLEAHYEYEKGMENLRGIR